MNQNSLNLRSEVVQEILSTRPHWLVRWGNAITLSVCGLLLCGALLVEYPVYVPIKINQSETQDVLELPSTYAKSLKTSKSLRLEYKIGTRVTTTEARILAIGQEKNVTKLRVDFGPKQIPNTLADAKIRVDRTFFSVIVDQLFRRNS